MPEDTLTLRTDPTNSFDVLQRLGTASDRLGQSGARLGDGFVRGDRAVRTATQNITQGLLTANNAADAALLTFQSLERVFKIPIGATIGVAAAVAGVAALRNEAKKTEEAYNALKETLRVPLSVDIALSPADIGSRIEDVTKKTDDLIRRRDSFGQKALQFFAGPLLSTPAAMQGQLNDEIIQGQERRVTLSHQLGDSELKLANIKSREVDAEKDLTGISKEQIDIERLGIEIEQKRAKLLEDFIGKGGIALDVYQRMLAVQVTIGAQIKKDIADIVTKRDKIAQDIGSGKFLKDLQQKQQQESDKTAGLSQAQGFANAAAKGIPLGPGAQAILDIARSSGLIEDDNKPVGPIPGGRTAEIGESQDLVNQIEKNRIDAENFNRGLDDPGNRMDSMTGGLEPDDFIRLSDGAGDAATALSTLAEMDFRGLAPLDGLTISIQ